MKEGLVGFGPPKWFALGVDRRYAFSGYDDSRRASGGARLLRDFLAAFWADYGIEPGYLRRLIDYWRTDYDWRAVEARLNRLPQFMASVGSYRVHLVYEPGSGPAPLPLVLTHGWPGSFVEFEAVVEPLAHPERFGGRIEDAFCRVLGAGDPAPTTRRWKRPSQG